MHLGIPFSPLLGPTLIPIGGGALGPMVPIGPDSPQAVHPGLPGAVPTAQVSPDVGGLSALLMLLTLLMGGQQQGPQEPLLDPLLFGGLGFGGGAFNAAGRGGSGSAGGRSRRTSCGMFPPGR